MLSYCEGKNLVGGRNTHIGYQVGYGILSTSTNNYSQSNGKVMSSKGGSLCIVVASDDSLVLNKRYLADLVRDVRRRL